MNEVIRVSRLALRDYAEKAPYCAVLGGTGTFAPLVERPFTALLQQAMGRSVVNLGYMNAGPDAFLNDPALASQANRFVVQIMDAHNVTNAFYSVHPRRRMADMLGRLRAPLLLWMGDHPPDEVRLVTRAMIGALGVAEYVEVVAPSDQAHRAVAEALLPHMERAPEGARSVRVYPLVPAPV